MVLTYCTAGEDSLPPWLATLNSQLLVQETAVTTTSKTDPRRPALLRTYANTLLKRFERTGRTAKGDIDNVIALKEEALRFTPETDPDMRVRLEGLGEAFQWRYESFQSTTDLISAKTDLNEAIRLKTAALNLTPEGQKNRPFYLNSLGTAIHRRFQLYGLLEDLNQEICLLRQAMSEGPKNPGVCQTNLGSALRSRYEMTGNSEDLDQAIEFCSDAVKSVPAGHPNLAAYMGNLNVALGTRTNRTDSLEDIDVVIDSYKQILEITTGNERDQAFYNINLGGVLNRRFDLTGSVVDASNAVEVCERAVIYDGPNRVAGLNNLSIALKHRFELTGSMDDLHRAVQSGAEAVKKSTSVRDKARYQQSLSTLLIMLYDATSKLDSINEAIGLLQDTLNTIPESDSERAIALHTLNNALRRRYNTTRSTEDFDEAIRVIDKAIVRKQAPSRQANLLESKACTLIAFVTNTRDKSLRLSVIDQALETMMESVNCCSESSVDRAYKLGNLATVLIIHSILVASSRLADLEKAIQVSREANSISHESIKYRPLFLLATALRQRHLETHSSADLEEAMSLFATCGGLSSAPPLERIKAYIFAAGKGTRYYLSEECVEKSLPMFKAAVELLPLLSPRNMQRQDQERLLSQFSHLASNAAGITIRTGGSAVEALKLLELGRGVLLSNTLEVRSDITELEEVHPELVRKFKSIRDTFDSSSLMDDLSFAEVETNQHRLSQEFQRVLLSIRELDGFKDFLRSPSGATAYNLSAPRKGAIVVLNPSQVGSHAIIITQQSSTVLPLPELKFHQVQENVTKLFQLLGKKYTERKSTKRPMHNLFEWLWRTAIEPIMNELGFVSTPNDDSEWPRVWWVPVGVLSVFPIHAAGNHTAGSKDNVLSRVISSYTPSIKALDHARKQATKSSHPEIQKAVLISMPETPERPDLRYVVDEVATVLNVWKQKNGLEISSLPTPRKVTVLGQIKNCNIVHFACHGEVDADSPSASRLLLSDWQENSLSVMDVIRCRIENAQMAYLSACHAANTRNLALLDENIHMASAFLLAGFPSVVGTLWHIGAKDSVTIAESVYIKCMTSNGTVDNRKTAAALHMAVRELRERTRYELGAKEIDDPVEWAAYIHVGT